MVNLKNVTKSFGDLHVLKNINLEIKKGEIVSIVGPSGAGKTTLLQILGTLDKPNIDIQSEIMINGINTLQLNSKALSYFRNSSIGFVFQFNQLLPEFTALENVCIPAYIKGISRDAAEKKAMELLNYLGLSNRVSHKPSALSGGEQQRVAVARALINSPALILADEPSGNLDSDAAYRLHELFRDLRDRFGYTFVIVTHNNELAKMADRIITISNGQIKVTN